MLVTNYCECIEDEIFSFHDGSFPFPSVNDSTIIEKKTVVDKGRIIGSGFVKLTTEFILIMDKTAPLRSRVLGINKLQKEILQSLANKGIKDIHIFCNDAKVAKLAEHYGFQPCPEKYAMGLIFG